jgi:hypothetical protein
LPAVPEWSRDYAGLYSRSHDAVISVYDAAGNVIETHEHKGGISKKAELIACIA